MLHKDIPVGADSSHPPGYVQAGDPGAVGANKVWIDTSGGTGNWLTKIRNAANGAWETLGSAVGALDDLSDVDTTGQTAGDVLAYDGADWIPTDLGVIPADLDDLSDVDTTGVGSGDVLTYDGADWIAQAPTGGGSSGERTKVDPTAQSWAWINQSGATVTTDGAAISLFCAGDSSNNHKMRITAVPAKPYSVIIHATLANFVATESGFSVGWLDSADNDYTGFHQYYSGAIADQAWRVGKSGADFAYDSEYITTTRQANGAFRWIKLSDAAAGNRKIEVSPTGLDGSWITVHSVATDDFLTPDNLFFGIHTNLATQGAAVTIDSWEEL